MKLRKPLAVGDKTLDELAFDFDKLTGVDAELAATEANIARGGVPVQVLSLDPHFQLQIASRASGVAVENLRKIGVIDYLAVLQAVQGFLFVSG